MAKRSMKKLKAKKQSWIRGLVMAYLVLIMGVVVGMGSYYVAQVSGVLAETPAGSTTGLDFKTYFCDVVAPIGGDVVMTLTVLMLVAAGITYLVSMGQSGGDIGGISTAKSMITAAITGMLLYLMSTLLLGQCGFTPGGWIFSLFGNGSSQPGQTEELPTGGTTTPAQPGGGAGTTTPTGNPQPASPSGGSSSTGAGSGTGSLPNLPGKDTGAGSSAI